MYLPRGVPSRGVPSLGVCLPMEFTFQEVCQAHPPSRRDLGPGIHLSLWTDPHLWEHYLPATLLASGKYNFIERLRQTLLNFIFDISSWYIVFIERRVLFCFGKNLNFFDISSWHSFYQVYLSTWYLPEQYALLTILRSEKDNSTLCPIVLW